MLSTEDPTRRYKGSPAGPSGKSVYVKERDVLRLIAERFREALMPLARAEKLGVIVFQFPPWFDCKSGNMDYVLFCKQLMAELSLAVEFRHGSWLSGAKAPEVLAFLREHAITYIAADEPQYGTLATVPFVPFVTTDTAYFRFHGRNGENWLKKGIATSLRYAYTYSDAGCTVCARRERSGQAGVEDVCHVQQLPPRQCDCERLPP